LLIKGIQKTSLIDYPGNICSVLFVAGCNFRCGYCHNPELISNSPELPTISEQRVLDFLEQRKKFIDGVCISGGEPTIYEELLSFCTKVKKKGLLVKIDTNGSNPDMLRRLIESKSVDYIAMDIKSSLPHYKKATSQEVNTEFIRKSIDIIMNSGVDYEFRTTAQPNLIDADQIREISQLVKGAKLLAIQQFNNISTFDPLLRDLEPYLSEKLEEFKEIAQPFVQECEVRGT
jgi:pyruvate formate lyase activating enzyme